MAFMRKSSSKKLTRKEKAEALKIAAAMFMSKRDSWPSFEVQINMNLRADLVCVSRDYRITIIEIKSSKADFKSDKKWESYLPFCDEFYFCSDYETIKFIRESVETKHPEVGYFYMGNVEKDIYPDGLNKWKPSKIANEALDRMQMMWLISRTNCLFLRGMYKGLHKINTALISPEWNIDKNYKGTLGGLIGNGKCDLEL